MTKILCFLIVLLPFPEVIVGYIHSFTWCVMTSSTSGSTHLFLNGFRPWNFLPIHLVNKGSVTPCRLRSCAGQKKELWLHKFLYNHYFLYIFSWQDYYGINSLTAISKFIILIRDETVPKEGKVSGVYIIGLHDVSFWVRLDTCSLKFISWYNRWRTNIPKTPPKIHQNRQKLQL